MVRDGLVDPDGEALALEQLEKQRDGVVDQATAEVAKTGNYDVVRGFLNFLITGRLTYKNDLRSYFTNVYPDWMKTQLATNDSTIMVEDENNQLVEVSVNEPGLPDYQTNRSCLIYALRLWVMNIWRY